jgi:hypothetical protein
MPVSLTPGRHMPLNFEYEPDEAPKKKHAWSEPTWGFVEGRSGERVGKCPQGVTLEAAREAMNQGIPWRNDRSKSAWPDRIYFVYDGHLYHAKPTRPGVSYHAFPVDPEHPDRVPAAVRRELKRMVEDHAGLRRSLKVFL